MKRAAPAPRLQLPLEPRDRDLRPRVLPLEPVVLPAHAREGDRLPGQRPGQLVPLVPDRARQRAGRGRDLLALQERRSSSATWSSGSCGSPPTRTSSSTTWRSSRPGRSASCVQQQQLGGQVARAPRSTSRSRASRRSASSRPASTPSTARPSWSWPPSTRWWTALLAGRPTTRPTRKEQIGRLRAQDRRARLEGKVEKEGVFTGRYATNPFTGEKIPIWVGNFVLMGYGTGAIMSVPAHDQRDFEFARKYGIEVRVVIQPEGEAARRRDARGGLRRPRAGGEQRRLRRPDAPTRRSRGWPPTPRRRASARPPITYRLKDWLISRQRYWGTPIPVVYCETDGVRRCPTTELPVVLPDGRAVHRRGRQPAREGARVRRAPPARSAGARRGARPTPWTPSWTRPGTSTATSRRARTTAPSTPAAVRYWFPIDLYVGGIEHAILHLVYSRFWTKVMRDLGLVDARRAGDAPLPAGDGPQGRRGDVEVEGQHRRPRRRDRPLRGRHPAALHPLRRPAGAGHGVERERHRGAAPLPPAGLAPRRPPRRGPRAASRAAAVAGRAARGRPGTCAARCTRRSTRSRATSRSASSSTPRWRPSWSW